MNFLNKKHVQSFANTGNTKGYAPQEDSSSFSPYTGSYISNKTQINKGIQMKQSPTAVYQSNSRVIEREVSQYSSNYGDRNVSKSSIPPPPNSLSGAINLCPQHENEILRHLCLQCDQLLCSQCISDHLQDHRQRTKTIPKIETINKLKKQMNIKAQKILQFMEENNPKVILNDVSQLKYEAITKIHDMKEQVIKAFEQWCKLLQKHVIQDEIEEKQLGQLTNQMGKLREQVLGLYNQMIGPQNVNAEIIKKVHQIDSEKLEAVYLEMFNKFSKTVLKSKFTFEIDFNYLMETFEKAITLKRLHAPSSARNQSNNQATSLAQQQKRNSSKNLPKVGSKKEFNNQQQISSQEKQRQFMQIQSIESLVEPTTSLRTSQQTDDIPLIKNRSKQAEQNDDNIERKFSRQVSGKRLAIFATSEDSQNGEENQQ